MKPPISLALGLVMALIFPGQAYAKPAQCLGERATIAGGPGADTLEGTPGRDVVAGRGGNDTITGAEGDDLICGGGGDDRLEGGPGNDTIRGQAKNDFVAGGPGDDDLDGGRRYSEDYEWVDVVTFAGSPEGVVIDGPAGTATGEGSDVIAYFERIEGSQHDDRIQGGGGAANLRGLAGNDRLIGGEWWGAYAGGPGDDFIDSTRDVSTMGGGSQVAYFDQATQGVEVDLAAGTATGDGEDTLLNISHVRGSEHDDVLLGSDHPNGLYGEGGDDYLDGRGEFDIVTGDEGDDVMHGGDDYDQVLDGVSGGAPSGNDELYGDAGNDSLFIADGSDLYDGGSGYEVLVFAPVEGLVVDLAAGTITGDGNGDDRLAGIEGAANPGYADGGSVTLIGDDGPNRLTGGAGDDTIRGGGGDDELMGSRGDDDIDGGPGTDSADGQRGSDRCIAVEQAESCER